MSLLGDRARSEDHARYAGVASGVSRRLGTVTGNSAADFKIQWSLINGQTISLTATPIGGRGAAVDSGQWTVISGQRSGDRGVGCAAGGVGLWCDRILNGSGYGFLCDVFWVCCALL